jgi:hypothetical protein
MGAVLVRVDAKVDGVALAQARRNGQAEPVSAAGPAFGEGSPKVPVQCGIKRT